MTLNRPAYCCEPRPAPAVSTGGMGTWCPFGARLLPKTVAVPSKTQQWSLIRLQRFSGSALDGVTCDYSQMIRHLERKHFEGCFDKTDLLERQQ